MATRVELNEIKQSVVELNKLSKEFLKDYDSAIKKIAKSGQELKKVTNSLDLKNSKDLSKVNVILKETNSLTEKKIKLDKQKTQALTQEQKLTQKLNQLKNNELDQTIKLRAEIQKETAERRKNAKETLNQSKFYAKLTSSVNKAQAEFKELAAEFGVNSKQAQKALNKFNKLDDSLRKINDAARDGRRDVGRYGLAVKGLAGGFRNILGGLGVVGGIQLIGQAFRDGVKTIRSFELETSRLAGLLGTTSEGIQQLTSDAQRLGSSTTKTASEVVQLQQAYARLGFSQKEIIDLTGDTINGSIALNASLDETAELTGAVVRTFDDFTTTDAGTILDQLTLATQKSALNFEKLQTALPIVAGAANTAGVPFTKLVALLGKLSDSGIDASSSSTALRNIFIESSAQGLGYEEILEKIVNSQDQLTASVDQFGKRAAVSSTILAKNIDGINDLDKALQGADGSAKKFADETLDTLDGRVQLLSSAYEGFVLSLNDSNIGLGKFVGGIVSLTTNVINFVTETKKGSDALIEQKTNINLLVDAITDENISQESRLRLLNKLQKQYPDYLSNLDTEKITNEELRDVLKQVNDQLINKIRIQINQEKINEAQERLVELIKTEDELRLRIAKEESTGKRTRQLFALKKQLDANVESQEKELDVINDLTKASDNLNESKKESVKIESKQKSQGTDTETEEEKKRRLTGAIEKQRELVNLLREDKEKAKKEDIAGLNALLELEEAKLKNLEDLGKLKKEQDEEENDNLSTITDETNKQFKFRELLIRQSGKTKEEIEEALLQNELDRIDALILAREKAGEDTIDLELQRQDLLDKRRDKALEDEQKRQEQLQKILLESIDLVGEQTLKLLDNRQEQIDKQIESSQREQETLARAIEGGSKLAEQSLAEQEARQDKLEAKQQQLATRRLIIEGTIAGLNAYAENGNVAETVSAIGTISSAIKELPAFYEGTDSVGSTNSETKFSDGKDGYLVRTNKGEIIFNNPQSDELRGLGYTTRESVLELARNSQTPLNADLTTNIIRVNNTDVVHKLDEVSSLLSTLHKRMPVIEKGTSTDGKYIKEVVRSEGMIKETIKKASNVWV